MPPREIGGFRMRVAEQATNGLDAIVHVSSLPISEVTEVLHDPEHRFLVGLLAGPS